MKEIPKIIHYCWFGNGELPKKYIKCIESWKKYCPDYEIVCWNEKSFDINTNNYVKQAYENGKYAFVSDYVRLYALYTFGGIYMDTDVEVIKNIDGFLNNISFLGFEEYQYVSTAVMASVKENIIFKELLNYYEDKSFIKSDGSMDTTTNVEIITRSMVERGLVLNNCKQDIDGLIFYPKEFFCPKEYSTGKINITKNTYTIHHFSGSWHTKEEKLMNFLSKKLGSKCALAMYYIIIVLWQPKKSYIKIKKKLKRGENNH